MYICIQWFLVVLWNLHGGWGISYYSLWCFRAYNIDWLIFRFPMLFFFSKIKLLYGISNNIILRWFLYNPIWASTCYVLTFLKFVLNVCRKLMNYVMNGFLNPLFLLLMMRHPMNHQCWRGNHIFSGGITLIFFLF